MDANELYDIFVVTACGHLPALPARADDHTAESCMQGGLMQIGLPLREIRSCLKAVREAGGNGLIVPARYRNPHLRRDEARALALAWLEEIRKGTADEFGELSEGRDEFLWWVFSADNLRAQAVGLIPGAVFIAIDKLDGHVRTLKEYQEWGRLSTLE